MPNSISDLRARIDSLDVGVLRLLAERMRTVAMLKPLKAGMVDDSAREAQVRATWAEEAVKLGLSPEFSTALLTIIFAESKRLQS